MSAVGNEPVPIDDSGRVAASIACINCEYNLRGLDTSSRCPECGETVERTMLRARLCFADPEWLGRLRAGSESLIVGLLLYSVCRFEVGGVGFNWFNLLWEAITFGLMLYGIFLLTTPERDERHSAVIRFVRIRTRALVLAGAVLGIVYVIAWNAPPSIKVVFVLMMHGCVLWAAVDCVRYLMWLAFRLPGPSIAKWLHRIRWAVVASIPILMILAGLAPFLAQRSGAATTGFTIGEFTYDQIWAGVIGVPALLLLIAAIIALLINLVRLRNSIADAREFALSMRDSSMSTTDEAQEGGAGNTNHASP